MIPRRAAALLIPVLLVTQTLLQLTPIATAAHVGTPGAFLTSLDTAYPATTQDLTASGSTDWAIWGTGTDTSLAPNSRKTGGTAISNLTDIIGPPPSSGTITRRALGQFPASTTPFLFSWSDGAPTASSTTDAGLQHNQSDSGVSQVGYGFSFTVPAGTASQRLALWIHAHGGTGKLTASVSGVATVLTDTGVSGGENQPGLYTIDFSAATNGQTMTVSYVLDAVGAASSAANYNNIAIYAAALSPTPGGAVATPALYQAIPQGGQTLVRGRLTASPSESYTLTVSTASTCAGGVLGSGGGATVLGTLSASTDVAGNSYFDAPVTNINPLQTYVTAEVTAGPGGATSGPSPCIVASPDNDQWPRALPIPILGGAGSESGYIDDSGRARWFKVAIQPGQRMQVSLSNLPADYDLFVFRDIAQTFNSLTTTTDLTRLSAEFAPSAFSPSAFSPSAFSPSAFSPSAFSPSAFSPSAFSPSIFSPSAFSPSAFSPSAFSPSAFSPSAFSPSAFSPSAFSPSAFSPSAFSPSAFSADTYASAQIRSLITGSAAAGLTPETVVVDTWNNTGDYYVRVSGKNGASSLDAPFTVSVTVAGSVCDGVVPAASDGFAAPAGSYETLILADPSRMLGTVLGNSPTDKSALQARLATFAARSEVGGAVVDVGARARIQTLNAQADANKSCMYAKNLVASATRDIVTAYRATNPGLKYVVIIGGDDAIPFFRYPDQTLLGPESDFAAPVLTGTASDASLRSNYVLGQDAYGASIDLSVRATTFPIPDLPVGRLVETAAEASGMLDAYLLTAAGTIATPTSSLVSGYDFLEDAARSVSADLAAGLGTGGTVTELISGSDVAPATLCGGTAALPNCSWNADALRTALLNSRNDFVYLAGHFSANSALAADFATTFLATELDASSADLLNSIVFSAGCHSGYNVVDPDAVAGGSVDWAQAFARKQATLIAGTGYQYGDTDFLEYSERIYAEFARQLRVGSGPVSVGDALARAKQIYLATTPDIRGLHEKALLEATLFGLPMLSVNMPSGRLPAPTSGSVVVTMDGFAADPGLTLGLQSADVPISPSLVSHTVPLTSDGGPVTATYYSGSDGVVTNPGEPAVPLESRDVSVTGKVLRGVGFRGGSYTDQTVVPLTGAPADPQEQIRGVHPGFASPVFFPMRLSTGNYFDALTGGPTRLLVTPAQHRATGANDGTNTLRLYSNLDLRLFYSSYTGASAASGAPTITGVTSEVVGGNVTFRARAVGDPAAGIQQVWVTYTGNADTWTSLDLTQDPTDSTLWSRTIPLPPALPGRAIEFLVQAVNGVGLVTLDDNLGRTYSIGIAGQTIAFAPLASKTYLDPDFTVAAAASSGLVVSFSASGSCSISGATVHLTAAGSCTITASQAGDSNFSAAADVAQAFTIARAGQTITLSAPTTKTFGDPDFAVTASSSSGLPVTLTAAGGCTISGTTVHIVAVGVCTITGSQSGDTNYSPAVDATATIRVIWPFTGFFSPVDNLPVLNTVKAGSTVPVKFSLGGNRGLAIFFAGYPGAVKITCASGVSIDPIEETNTSNSGLTYDATTDRYKYNWKTPKSYLGSCYRLDLKLVDGSTYSANFQFK